MLPIDPPVGNLVLMSTPFMQVDGLIIDNWRFSATS
jgi:hypothetical protein